jgi:predicted mannosyl-3-phosphoglycerate phosphatase (HAD superfamily)
MKQSTITFIIGTVIALGTLAGSVIAVDSRYTHHDEFIAFVADYQADTIQKDIRSIDQREWQLEDRAMEQKKKNLDTTDLNRQVRELEAQKVELKEKLKKYQENK